MLATTAGAAGLSGLWSASRPRDPGESKKEHTNRTLRNMGVVGAASTLPWLASAGVQAIPSLSVSEDVDARFDEDRGVFVGPEGGTTSEYFGSGRAGEDLVTASPNILGSASGSAAAMGAGALKERAKRRAGSIPDPYGRVENIFSDPRLEKDYKRLSKLKNINRSADKFIGKVRELYPDSKQVVADAYGDIDSSGKPTDPVNFRNSVAKALGSGNTETNPARAIPVPGKPSEFTRWIKRTDPSTGKPYRGLRGVRYGPGFLGGLAGFFLPEVIRRAVD